MPTSDLGPAGPATGAPIHYVWPISRHLARFILWLVLIVLMLRPVNRRRGVWKIVLPALLLQLAAIAAEVYLPALSSGTFMIVLDQLVLLAMSLTFVWLLAGLLSLVAAPAAASMLVVATFAAGVFQVVAWMGMNYATFGMLLLNVLLSAAVVLAMVLARVFCRQRYSSGRFKGAVSISVMGLCQLVLPFIALMAVIQASALEDASMALVFLGGGFLVLLVTGFVLSALVWVYLAITYRTPELRERFERVFRLHTEPQPPTISLLTGTGPVGKGAV